MPAAGFEAGTRAHVSDQGQLPTALEAALLVPTFPPPQRRPHPPPAAFPQYWSAAGEGTRV